MSYQIRRLDPYGINHPGVGVVLLAGLLLAMLGARMEQTLLMWAGVAVASLSVLAAAKPAVSAVFGVLGFLGGLLTFVVFPREAAAGLTAPQRLLAVIVFVFFYAVLMDAVVLLVAILYNLFCSVLGMEGFRMDITEAESEESGS